LFDDIASQHLMFDDKGFPKSKKYFQMQQLYRIFNNYVEETIRDLQYQRESFMSEWDGNLEPELRAALSDVGFEWEKSLAIQLSRLNVLLDRIRRKKEEVESLRDGVSLQYTHPMLEIDTSSCSTLHPSAKLPRVRN
jgi:hypothetical protein